MSDVLIAHGLNRVWKVNFRKLSQWFASRGGEGLRSCTPEVQTSNSFELLGHQVTLIDTPGFDDTLKTDTEILRLITSFLADRYRSHQELSGVVYVHRISDFKLGGISRRTSGMFRSLCGDTTLQNVVVATNMWSEVAPEKGAAREHELATDPLLFRPVLERCARLMRHDNTVASAQAILATLLGKAPLALQIQRELVKEHKALEATAASAALKTQELCTAEARHEDALHQQREAAEAAIRAQEEELAWELAEVLQLVEIQEAEARAEQERMLIAIEAAHMEEEERLQQVQQAFEEEVEARRLEEVRLQLVREQQEAEAREAEEARQRHQVELVCVRRERDGDCVVA